MDRNIYKCPACGSKRITTDKYSVKVNLIVSAFLAAIPGGIGVYYGWTWLYLASIVLVFVLMALLPTDFYCLSCRRSWRKEQIKIVGQVEERSS